jgi:mannan endo-1,4-beta-mannosidase
MLSASAASWSWFCIWNGYLQNEDRNETSMVNYMYNHDTIITLDELPDLLSYPLP